MPFYPTLQRTYPTLLEAYCRADFPLFCAVVLAALGYAREPLHDLFIAALLTYQWGTIKAFRGSAKTFYTLCFAIWTAWAHPHEYVVIASGNAENTRETMGKAAELIELFPWLWDSIKPPHAFHLTRASIRFTNGSQIKGRSYGSNIRGIGNLRQRITLYLGDDIYPERHALTMSLPEYTSLWLEAVEKAIEPHTGRLWLIGTPLDVADLFATLATDPAYLIHLIIPVLDPLTDTSVWERRFPTTQMHRDRTRYPVAFARQMLVDPVPPAGIDFQRAWLLERPYHHQRETDFRRIFVDLAVSAKDTADYAGIVDTVQRGQAWFVRGAWAIRGVDAVGAHLTLLDHDDGPPIRHFLIEAPGALHLLGKKTPSITALGGRVEWVLSVTGAKLERIDLLRPWFQGGYVHIDPHTCGPFLTEYLGFPVAHHLHCLDAFAGGVARFAKAAQRHAWAKWL